MNKTTKNLTIYIDGENIFFQLVEILIDKKIINERGDLLRLDLRWLLTEATRLSTEQASIRYYGTKLHVVNELGQRAHNISLKMIQHKRAWGSWLAAQNIEFITAGNLKARSKGRGVVFQEKGVDVRLAVDIVEAACEQKGQHFIVVSSDSDIIPALRVASARGQRLTYIGFSEALNKAIVANVHQTLTFTREDVLIAYKRAQKDSNAK